MQYSFEESAGKGVTAARFIEGHDDIIALFHDIAQVQRVAANTQGNKEDVCEDIRQLVNEGGVAKAMFKKDWFKAGRQIFCNDLAKQIQVLKDNAFSESDIDSYEA